MKESVDYLRALYSSIAVAFGVSPGGLDEIVARRSPLRNVHHGNDRIVHDVAVDDGVFQCNDAGLPGLASSPTDTLQRLPWPR